MANMETLGLIITPSELQNSLLALAPVSQPVLTLTVNLEPCNGRILTGSYEYSLHLVYILAIKSIQKTLLVGRGTWLSILLLFAY